MLRDKTRSVHLGDELVEGSSWVVVRCCQSHRFLDAVGRPGEGTTTLPEIIANRELNSRLPVREPLPMSRKNAAVRGGSPLLWLTHFDNHSLPVCRLLMGVPARVLDGR